MPRLLSILLALLLLAVGILALRHRTTSAIADRENPSSRSATLEPRRLVLFDPEKLPPVPAPDIAKPAATAPGPRHHHLGRLASILEALEGEPGSASVLAAGRELERWLDRHPERIETLVEMLDPADLLPQSVRPAVVDALFARLGEPARQELHGLLRRQEREHRARALAFRPELLGPDLGADWRRRAADALSVFPRAWRDDLEVRDRLLDLATRSPDRALRRAAIRRLGEVSHPYAVALLVEICRRPARDTQDEHDATAAARALAAHQHASVPHVWIEALAEGSAWRAGDRFAAIGLARFVSDDATAALADAVRHHPDPLVQRHALESLARHARSSERARLELELLRAASASRGR